MTAPMTAAEYRRSNGFLTERGNRILAALEEREALLEQAKFGSADASVGALVRRIREHPMAASALRVSPKERRAYPFDDFWRLTEEGLTAALSHLDSLLPKEPEVVVGPSGIRFRRRADGVIEREWGAVWQTCFTVEMCDAPVVAALLGGRNAK